MNKVTTCCKARYTSYYDVIKTSIIEGHKCQKCHKSCTLEDVPAESWEDRFYKLWDKAHEDVLVGDMKNAGDDIIDFIKSELELRDSELINKIIEYRETRINEDSLETIDDILDLIKNK